MKNSHGNISSISKTFILMLVGLALTFGAILTIAVILTKISFSILFSSDDSKESSITHDLVKIRSNLK
jgi:hypothetical protein